MSKPFIILHLSQKIFYKSIRKIKGISALQIFCLKWQGTGIFNMSDLHGKDAGDICSKLDVIWTTMTLIEIEKFTGD